MVDYYQNSIDSKDWFLFEETSAGQQHNSYVDLGVKIS